MGNFKSFKKVVLLVMLVVFTASVGTPVVTPAWAAGLIKIDQILNMGTGGGTGGGASTVTRDEIGDITKVETSDNAKTIYFGKYWQSATSISEAKEAIKWRVLSVSAPLDTSGTNNKGVLLLSDQGLYADAFNGSTVKTNLNVWGKDASGTESEISSEIRTTLNDRTLTAGQGNGFAADAFDQKEFDAIASTKHTAGGNQSGNDNVSTDKLFLLNGSNKDNVTVGEIYNIAYGFANNDSRISTATTFATKVAMYGNNSKVNVQSADSEFAWLRSPGSFFLNAFGVDFIGKVGESTVFTDTDAVRPAFNLNPESVLFLSAAEATTAGSKDSKSRVSVGDGFALADYDGSKGWKVTLKDGTAAPTGLTAKVVNDGSFDVNKLAEAAAQGGTLNISGSDQDVEKLVVTSATALPLGEKFLSALLCDATGNTMLNYAKVATGDIPIGDYNVSLAGVAAGNYNVRFFTETVSTDYLTDYASELTDATAIKVTGGDVVTTLKSEYGTKGLTASLSDNAVLGFEAGEYDTVVKVSGTNTATIKGSESAEGTILTGGIKIGGTGDTDNTLITENFFNVVVDSKAHKVDNWNKLINNGILLITNKNSDDYKLGSTVINNGVIKCATTGGTDMTLQNGGTWYPFGGAAPNSVTMGASASQGVIDLGYTDVQVQMQDGKQVAVPTYDAKSSFTTQGVQNLVINNGLLKIQSYIAESKADKLNVSTSLTISDPDKFHIQIMKDPYFSNVGAVDPQSITVFSSNIDLTGKWATDERGYLVGLGIATEMNGIRFTPNFKLDGGGKNIILTGFSNRAVHVYDWKKDPTVWDASKPIPYGSVVRKDEQGELHLYKVVTGTGVGRPWGRVGRGLDTVDSEKQVTKRYDWGDSALVEHSGEGDGDIVVVYNDTNPAAATQKPLDETITAYVGLGQQSGTAIYNTADQSAKNVTADFLGNFGGQTSTTNLSGGTIYNKGKIGSITGDFIGNHGMGTANVWGGVIFSGGIENARIGAITGDFIGNYAKMTGGNAVEGGVIHVSQGTIGTITGDFIGNYAENVGGNAQGGAIQVSNGAIETITGDFIGNYARNTGNGGSALGGAIYNNIGTTNIVADTQDILFSGNYVSATNGTALGGAIYNAKDNEGHTGTVKLYAGTGKSITFEGREGDAIVDSVHNIGKLYINDTDKEGTWDGTVNFATITDTASPAGEMYINGGTVNVKGDVTQKTIVNNATLLSLFGASNVNGLSGSGNTAINENAILNISGDVTQSSVTVSENASLNFTGDTELGIDSIFNGGSVSIANGGAVHGKFNFKMSANTEIVNRGTWYDDADTASLAGATVILSDGGTIDIAYSALAKDAKGKFTPTYNKKTQMDTATVASLTINKDSSVLLKIQSDLTASKAVADSLNATALTVGESNMELKIQVYDPAIATMTESITGMKVTVFKGGTSADLRKLTITGVKSRVSNFIITPQFSISSNTIRLTGFDYRFDHRYGLTKGAAYSGGEVPYGNIVQDGYLYKIGTGKDEAGTSTPWGRVGREIDTGVASETLAFDWDNTAKALKPHEGTGGDVVVEYNKTNKTDQQQTKFVDSTGKAYTAFVGANSTSNGGAVNPSDNYTDEVMADFVYNHVTGGGNNVFGGAIYNTKEMGNVTGDFIGNYVSGNSETKGGAIYNEENAKIGNISGDFIGNRGTTTSGEAYGGAIFIQSNATIGNIIGDFLSNSVSSTSDKARGGAIYVKEDAEVGDITGDFIANYVESKAKAALGGAIYNKSTVKLLAEGTSITFSGNYVSAPDGKDALGGAIYNDGGTVKLYAASGKSITFEGREGNTAADKVVDSVHNIGKLYVNDTDIKDASGNNYTGAVNFATITDASDPAGEMYINGGTANIAGDVTQSSVTVAEKASLNFTGNTELGIGSIDNKGSINITKGGAAKGKFNFAEASATKAFTNSGTWYPVFATHASDNAGVTLSDGGTIDIAYDTLTKDAKGKFTPTYNKKTDFDTATVSNLTVNYGMLKIQSALSSSEGQSKADLLIASAVNLGTDAKLKIQVMNDQAFATAESFMGDEIKVLQSTAVLKDKLSVIPVGTVRATGTFMPSFKLSGDGKDIYLAGFDFKKHKSAGGENQAYAWATVSAYQPGEDIPLGHVVRYDAEGTPYIYRVVTDTEKGAWGLVGRKKVESATQETKKFNWGETSLVEETDPAKFADIVVTYDASKKATTHQTSFKNTDGAFTAFVGANSRSYGGAVSLSADYTDEVKADFVGNNSASSGGAIYNYNRKMGNVTGDFIGNRSDSYGGAIYTYNGVIGDITGDFVGNYATDTENRAYGGAFMVYRATIGVIKGDFIGNHTETSTTAENALGGAIYSYEGVIKEITGDFIGNYAKSDNTYAQGGAIYVYKSSTGNATVKILADDKNIRFSGNTVFGQDASKTLGGAIYNQDATVKLYAASGKSITFEGRADDALVDSIHNIGKLYINGDGDTETGYTGTVNFATITDNTTPKGEMYINGGTVGISGTVTQKTLTINDGLLKITSNVASETAGSITVDTLTLATSDNKLKISAHDPIFATAKAEITGHNITVLTFTNGTLTLDQLTAIGEKGMYGLFTPQFAVDGNSILLTGFTYEALPHRFVLEKGAEWTSGNPIPYGSVVQKGGDKFYLYKVVTDKIDAENYRAWGRVGRELDKGEGVTPETKRFVWHTADPSAEEEADKRDHLKEVTDAAADADIVVTYNAAKKAEQHKESFVDASDGNKPFTSFVGAANTTDGSGGAVKNSSAYSTEVKADFVSNKVISATTSSGGAIFNDSTMGAITGDFIANSIGGMIAAGGAISNYSTMGAITGDFIGNNSIGGMSAVGGAICNDEDASIGAITGDFIGNFALQSASGGMIAAGGAIDNGGTITATGDFIGNYASGKTASGGAIDNGGTITVTGDFIGNYAKSTSGEAWGGAIYNEGTVKILAKGRDIKLSGNTVSAEEEGKALGGAIYNNTTVKLYVSEGKSITFEGRTDDAMVDSVYNDGNLFINDTDIKDEGDKFYTGDVKFAEITNTKDGAIKGNMAAGNFTNQGVWYPVFDAETHTSSITATVALSKSAEAAAEASGGTIDIAHSALTEDSESGAITPTYEQRIADGKPYYVTATVSDLTIDNGLLRIQSDVDGGAADELVATKLSVDADTELHIEVMYDPCFSTAKEVSGKSIAVVTASNGLGALSISNIIGNPTTVAIGTFTPTFKILGTDIILTGFNFEGKEPPTPTEVKTTSEALGSKGAETATTFFEMKANEKLTEEWGTFVARLGGKTTLTLKGAGASKNTVDGDGNSGLTVNGTGHELTVDSITVTNMANPFTVTKGKLTLNNVTIGTDCSGNITNNDTLDFQGITTFNSALTLTGSGNSTVTGALTGIKLTVSGGTVTVSNTGSIENDLDLKGGTLALSADKYGAEGGVTGDVTLSHGTLKFTSGTSLNQKVSGDGILEFAANLSADAANVAADTNKVNASKTLTLTKGEEATSGVLSKDVENSGSVTAKAGVKVDSTITNESDTATVTLEGGETAEGAASFGNAGKVSGGKVTLGKNVTFSGANLANIKELTCTDSALYKFTAILGTGATADPFIKVKDEDFITVAGKATGKIKLSTVTLTGAGSTDWAAETSQQVQFMSATGAGSDLTVSASKTVISTSTGYTYIFSQAKNGDSSDKIGWMDVLKKEGIAYTLKEIINAKDEAAGSIDNYVVSGTDASTTKDLGGLDNSYRDNFTISGDPEGSDPSVLDGNGHGGIIVADPTQGGKEGDTLSINDVTMKNFKVAVTNKKGGNVNFTDVTFTEAQGDADVVNEGTVNLAGNIGLDKGVADEYGTGTINTANGTVITGQGEGTTIETGSFNGEGNVTTKKLTMNLGEGEGTVAGTATFEDTTLTGAGTDKTKETANNLAFAGNVTVDNMTVASNNDTTVAGGTTINGGNGAEIETKTLTPVGSMNISNIAINVNEATTVADGAVITGNGTDTAVLSTGSLNGEGDLSAKSMTIELGTGEGSVTKTFSLEDVTIIGEGSGDTAETAASVSLAGNVTIMNMALTSTGEMTVADNATITGDDASVVTDTLTAEGNMNLNNVILNVDGETKTANNAVITGNGMNTSVINSDSFAPAGNLTLDNMSFTVTNETTVADGAVITGKNDAVLSTGTLTPEGSFTLNDMLLLATTTTANDGAVFSGNGKGNTLLSTDTLTDAGSLTLKNLTTKVNSGNVGSLTMEDAVLEGNGQAITSMTVGALSALGDSSIKSMNFEVTGAAVIAGKLKLDGADFTAKELDVQGEFDAKGGKVITTDGMTLHKDMNISATTDIVGLLKIVPTGGSKLNFNFILDGFEKKNGYTFINADTAIDLSKIRVNLIQNDTYYKLSQGGKMILVSNIVKNSYKGQSVLSARSSSGVATYTYSVGEARANKLAKSNANDLGGIVLGEENANDVYALVLGYLGHEATKETKSFSQAKLAVTAAVNSGSDLIATSVMENATPSGKKWETFAALGGSRNRYDEIGSNVDLNMFNVAAGLSGKVFDNLTLGVFVEGGDGRYNTEDRFAAESVLAKGDVNYFGGGLFAKYEGKKTDLGQFHGEASMRAGHINSKYNSANFNPGTFTSFDLSGSYLGAHAGFGYKWNVSGKRTIDTYVKYLWSRQGNSSNVMDGETIDLEAINSHRLRAGFRLNGQSNDKGFNLFGGLAYEYEFDGKAKGSVGTSAMPMSDFKGGSGLAEFGVKFDRLNSAWKGELSLQGYTGRRDSIGANLSIWYMFGK